MKRIAWGIVGSSSVTEQFCRQLVKVPGSELRQFCSRRINSAQRIGKTFNVKRTTTELSDLLNDDQIQAVYISSPTHLHTEHTLACLVAGKAVLCEKPLASSSADIEKIITASRVNNVFCMEGMWMRFNPLVQQLKAQLHEGSIGNVKTVRIEIGYQKNLEKLDGPERGALWNFSVYGISLLQYLFGELLEDPQVISDVSGGTRVNFTAQMRWRGAPMTSLTSAVDVNLDNEAVVTGTRGSLRLSSPFFCPSQLRSSLPLFGGSRISSRINHVFGAMGLNKLLQTPYLRVCDDQAGFFQEALEVHKAMNNNQIESRTMPLSDSLAVVQIAEKIESGDTCNETA